MIKHRVTGATKTKMGTMNLLFLLPENTTTRSYSQHQGGGQQGQLLLAPPLPFPQVSRWRYCACARTGETAR